MRDEAGVGARKPGDRSYASQRRIQCPSFEDALFPHFMLYQLSFLISGCTIKSSLQFYCNDSLQGQPCNDPLPMLILPSGFVVSATH